MARTDGTEDVFAERVRSVIAALEPGDVASYGEISMLAGRPGAGRAVGTLLARSRGLPWWRVVNASGRLVPGHEAEQSRRLRAEGVGVSAGRVTGFRARAGRPQAATLVSSTSTTTGAWSEGSFPLRASRST